jgi:hypothetical protein
MSLVQLRIKVTVDLAGPSPPLLPLKVTLLLPLVISRLFLPNNLLVACPILTTAVVKVAAMELLLN